MREAFERAIREHPDDLSGYAAYADWLAERGDPRGEFMAVQIALEDETAPKAERDRLKEREAELLTAHERVWLGELTPFILEAGEGATDGGEIGRGEHAWRRGLLSGVLARNLTMPFARALAASPEARHLHDLRVEYFEEDEALLELLGSPCINSLRVFYLGDSEAEPPEDGWCDCHTGSRGLPHVVAGMARVEELHLLCKDYESANLFGLPNLTRLRVLRMYHLGGWDRGRRYEYALDVLAANPAFANLTHLLFHPHQSEGGSGGRDASYLPLDQVRALVRSPHLTSLTHLQLRLSDMGDDGIREIIDSGILKRLTWLDLRHGCVTDEGARLLAACPDARRLDRIDLSRNGVTAAGLTALRKAKVNAVANNPLTEQELDGREYLREGDFE
jgi:uncharacterized protein (TIGR02996 family)